MKVFLVINTFDAWSDEIFYRSSLHIASTHEKACQFVKKKGLDLSAIKEVELDGGEVSLCSESHLNSASRDSARDSVNKDSSSDTMGVHNVKSLNGVSLADVFYNNDSETATSK